MPATTRLLIALGCALLAWTGPAAAQDYPSHSITVVVPFPAGGPSDVVARIVAEHMSRTLGQSPPPKRRSSRSSSSGKVLCEKTG